jgi:hypothetical protein
MARSAQREELEDGEGLPLLLGMVLAVSVSLGLWLLVSYVSWLVLH